MSKAKAKSRLKENCSPPLKKPSRPAYRTGRLVSEGDLGGFFKIMNQ
jgi:hypothetical protein